MEVKMEVKCLTLDIRMNVKISEVKLFDTEHSNVECQNDMNVKRQTA